MISGSRFAFALAGFVVVGALLERLDEARGTNYLAWYTLIILLTFITAYRREFKAEVDRVLILVRLAEKGKASDAQRTTQRPAGR